ncbi:glycosyltransferase [Streptomyces sp. PTM05]|uniref:Glycosyltransferase n=1 Tax=Streptantibioticus parmotrematis TaxID=2873249 RepID=A0ABS7QL95_9ACTN|nr:glycosyltransferase [Streptantibioticus parmotrematis]MBY8883713.1 glycosyltransferase [Streptantibioticus parmotrematis]
MSRARGRGSRATGVLALAERAALVTVLGGTAAGVRNIVRSARWKHQARRGFAAVRADREPGTAYVFLLVPALREQRVIEGTLAHLRKLDYPADRFEILVAVDGKENGERSTAQVVEEYAKRHPDGAPITVVTHTGPEQRRSLQLNAALGHVQEQVRERLAGQRILVGVYDADSRPEAPTLAYLDDQLRRRPQASAFQQTVTYLANGEALARSRGLLHANAVYQGAWNHIFEVPRLLACRDRIAAGRSLPFPPYCMGHGEFFDLRTLEAVGGFPRTGPCDGIQIGFALSRAGIAIHPVPFDDACQSPTSHTGLIRQHTFWYSGNLQFFRWYRPSSLAPDTVLPLLTHTALAGRWLCRPAVFALAAAGAHRMAGWRGPVALTGLMYGYYELGAQALRLTSPPATGAATRSARGLVPLAVAFKSLGAGNAVARMLLRKSTFNKVER